MLADDVLDDASDERKGLVRVVYGEESLHTGVRYLRRAWFVSLRLAP
jgi:hypothetical protein